MAEIQCTNTGRQECGEGRQGVKYKYKIQENGEGRQGWNYSSSAIFICILRRGDRRESCFAVWQLVTLALTMAGSSSETLFCWLTGPLFISHTKSNQAWPFYTQMVISSTELCHHTLSWASIQHQIVPKLNITSLQMEEKLLLEIVKSILPPVLVPELRLTHHMGRCRRCYCIQQLLVCPFQVWLFLRS